MNIIKTYKDGTALAELTANEAHLIQRAQTAPIKRLVKRMTPQLLKLEEEVRNAREFNDKFITTFYSGKLKSKRRK